jgi:hypothetical protein
VAAFRDFLIARFSLMDLSDFLLADCRGDLSDTALAPYLDEDNTHGFYRRKPGGAPCDAVSFGRTRLTGDAVVGVMSPSS